LKKGMAISSANHGQSKTAAVSLARKSADLLAARTSRRQRPERQDRREAQLKTRLIPVAIDERFRAGAAAFAAPLLLFR
jgi:hypothetical protein